MAILGPGLGPASTITELSQITESNLESGACLYVNTVGAPFLLVKNSTATPDGITVVEGEDGGRWFRQLVPNVRWLQQATWFIDPTGNDENDGSSALTPLATTAELARRINGGTISVNTTVTLAPGTYADLVLDLSIGSGVIFTVQGAITATATGTLSAVTNSAPATFGSTSTRGAITNTGGDPTFSDKTRVRLTSGGNSGALAWVTRVIAANNVNVSRWANTNPASTTLPTIGNASIGNTYVVETLASTLRRVDLRCRGQGRILVRECNITISGASQAHRATGDQGTLGGVYFYSCLFGGSSSLWYEGNALFVSCAFQATATVFQNAYMAPRACVFTGSASLTIDGGTVVNFSRGNCFDGSYITCHLGWVEFTGTAPTDTEFSDISNNPALNIFPGGFVDNDADHILWGANNSMAHAIVVRSLSPGVAPQALNLLNIPGGTTADTSIGGNNTAYAALPFYDTAHGCGIVERV